ncbi:MAG: hypothetical protein H7Z75_01140 [Ferruginibacter sp.]|nr:hypothetical protein [Cytophagales bacterium]
MNALAVVAVAGLFHSCAEDGNSASPGTNGIGGSMARFAIGGDHLYTLDNNSLRVFDISQPDNPVPGAKISVGTGIETLFPYQDKLFIGSRSGMLIYDNGNPGQPTLLSRYAHVESCDPVVVQGDYAYVTLRDGTFCRSGSNLLDVVDIRNLQNPVVVRSIPMQHPHGLGVDGKNLFVSEGAHGLKVFNVADPRNPVQTQYITGVKTYDVIPLNEGKVLLVTGQDGLYQYDYSDATQLKLLSKIPIAH